MAHFAIIENDLVTNVLVVNNEVITDENGVEQEELGKQFLHDIFGYDPDSIVQTSYNNNFRGTYANIGYWYNPTEDVFLPKYDDEGWIYDIDGNIVDHIDPDVEVPTES